MEPVNILIVDDCPVVRLIIRKTLQLCPIEIENITEAANGGEGWEMVKHYDFDLVIADINMPVMSGTEMIAKIRIDPTFNDVSILTVSAESNNSRIGLLSRLTEGFVHKPFSPEYLRDKILKVLEKQTIISDDTK